MSLHRRWNAVIALLLFLGFAPMKAQAYSGGTTLDYTEGSIDLYGYSETWRDYWNPYSSLTCTNYGWDEYYQSYLCMNYILRAYYPSVTAELWDPLSTLNDSQYEWSYTVAHVNLVASQPLVNGTWSAYGVHMVEEDVYWGYIWSGGEYYWEYLGTNVDTFDYSSDDATVGCSTGAASAIIAEYVNSPHAIADLAPACAEFRTTSPFNNFSWAEFNDNWGQASQHPPWGHVKSNTVYSLDLLRDYYGPIYLSSGYRCPVGNSSLPQPTHNSHHIRGRAADMYRNAAHSWVDEPEFNELKDANELLFGPLEESFDYNRYGDHHYHAAW